MNNLNIKINDVIKIKRYNESFFVKVRSIRNTYYKNESYIIVKALNDCTTQPIYYGDIFNIKRDEIIF